MAHRLGSWGIGLACCSSFVLIGRLWRPILFSPFLEVRMGRHDGRLHEPAREVMRWMKPFVTGHLVWAYPSFSAHSVNSGSTVWELFRRPIIGRMMPSLVTFC